MNRPILAVFLMICCVLMCGCHLSAKNAENSDDGNGYAPPDGCQEFSYSSKKPPVSYDVEDKDKQRDEAFEPVIEREHYYRSYSGRNYRSEREEYRSSRTVGSPDEQPEYKAPSESRSGEYSWDK